MVAWGAMELPERVDARNLLLRPYRLTDVPQLVPLIGDRRVSRWLPRAPHPYTDADGRAWVEWSNRQRQAGEALELLAARRGDGTVIGGAGLRLDADGRGAAELGYWVGLPHQRVGYGRDMAQGMLSAAFDRLGLSDVWAEVDPANRPSQRLLIALGFEPSASSVSASEAHGSAAEAGGADRFVMTAARWRSLQGERA
jgi:RimJ/RimL family protein N-acetyltransferase